MAPRFDSPPASNTSPGRVSFSQPRPRPPKSAAEVADVRVKNRRRAYLDRNPGYFESSEHEFADPLLYHTLIRRFQGPDEQRAEAQKRGFARVLEASLLRGEERLSRLAAEDSKGSGSLSGDDKSGAGSSGPRPSNGTEPRSTSTALFGEVPGSAPDPNTSGSQAGPSSDLQGSTSTSARAATHPRIHLKSSVPTPIEAEILATSSVDNKEEALEMWQTFLKERFIRGGDEDFDYATVDDNDEFDLIEQRDLEEAWYDDEDPEWASDGDDSPRSSGAGNGRRKVERMLEGETGVQDY